MIAIIGAMKEEIQEILNEMQEIKTINLYNMDFYQGLLNNKNVVLVKCGIGMVNAAFVTTILVQNFDISNIYFSGVAGSSDPRLNIGDIVISSQVQEYLFDASAFGYDKGIIPRMKDSIFCPDKLLIDAKNKLDYKNVYFAKIVSGDKFVFDKNEKIKIGKEFNCMAIDMESAAVAHVAYLLNKDFLIIRSISDSLVGDSVMEYNEFVKLAAKNSKDIIKKLI